MRRPPFLTRDFSLYGSPQGGPPLAQGTLQELGIAVGPVIVPGIEAFDVGTEGTLFCLEVPRLGIQIIIVGPVVIQPVLHLLVESRNHLHVAPLPLLPQVLALYIRLHHGLFHLQGLL